MVRCKHCGKEFDEEIALGICPHCGNLYEEEIAVDTPESTDDSGSEKEDPRWLPVGTLLNGRYRVQKVIGVGGFGITYRTTDEKTGTLKAVKEYYQSGVVNRIPGTAEVLIAAPKRADEFEYGRERLLREAKIVAKFQSPWIVRVDDYFEENNTSYMVMEYIEFPTLEKYMLSQRRMMTTEEAVALGVHVSEALEEIHRAGVIHRDIAPDNLFINSNGEVKIIDFGSARLSKEDTDDRLIVLKRGFAPPEQYEKIDPKNDRQKSWTDVYALGATLYLCLTGVIPPESSDRKADADRGEDRLIQPSEVNPNIPEWLNNSIMTAMAVDIHERFKDTRELREALLQERKVLSIEKVRKKKRIRRTTGIAASIIVILAVAILGIRRYYSKREAAVLEAADITVWYVINEGDTQGEKSAQMDNILNSLNQGDIFADVDITFVGVPENEYDEKVKSAAETGELPNIIEYTGESEPAFGEYMDLKQIASEKKDECYFLDKYDSVYKQSDRLPTAFNIPVIYINTALATDYLEEMSFSRIEDFYDLCDGNLKFSPICIKADLKADYEEMLTDLTSEEDGLIIEDSIESFLDGIDAALYLGDSSDYFMVRNALAGSFAMEPVASDTIICRFSNEWCIRSVDEASDTAAREILGYMLSNYSQDVLYLQTSIPGLPIEKTALDSYPAVRRAFSELLSEGERKKFVFR